MQQLLHAFTNFASLTVNLYLNGHDHVLQHISWHGVEYVTSGHGTLTQSYPLGYWNYTRGSAAEKGSRFGAIGPGFGCATVTTDLLSFALTDRFGKDLYSFTLTNPRLATAQDDAESSSATLKPSVAFVLTLLGLLCGIFITIIFLRCSTNWRLRILGEPVIRVRKASHNSRNEKKKAVPTHNPFTISGEDEDDDNLEKGFEEDTDSSHDEHKQQSVSNMTSRSRIFGRNGYLPMQNGHAAIPGEEEIELSVVC